MIAQRRVPPLHPGIQIDQHRDLQEGGAGIGTVTMLRTQCGVLEGMRSAPREQEVATPHYRSLNISR